jgi:hypothetical protein
MRVISPQSATQTKRATRPRKRGGPHVGVQTKLIKVAPLDDADWLRLADALGLKPAEFDSMTVTKDFPWRVGVECVIKNAINSLEPVGSGPTVSQLATRLGAIAAETQKLLSYLLRRENIVALDALAEPEYSIGVVPEEYLAIGQLKRRALAKAEEVEAEADERLDQVYINAFLCNAVTLTRAAKLDCSLPTHGAEARADKFPAYQFTRALIDLAHLRAARVAPSAAAAFRRLRNCTPRTLCDKVRAARRDQRWTFLLRL